MAKKTTEQFIESAKLNHEDKFDYSKSLYISEKIELKIICKEHGEFLTLPTNHIKSDTGGCSKCFDASSGINKIIIHDNKYGQFITSDIKLFNKLKNLLSYKTAGVEYTAAYKNGWNGINYLLDKEGYFLSGLTPKVIKFAELNKIDITIIDKRKKIINNDEIDISDKLSKLNMIPREYQIRIVNSAISNNKGIIRAVTGAGKTLCIGLITAKINKPTIVCVIGLDLLKQFHDLFTLLFDEPIGFIGNGVCEIHRINIASIWTIGSALKIKTAITNDDVSVELAPNQIQSNNIINMLEKTKLIFLDECHVVTTSTMSHIYKKIDPEYIFGLSGTPYRDDGSNLLSNAMLGEQIVDVSASELIVDGYLAQPIIKFIRVPKLFIEGGTTNYQVVYKAYITENIIRNNLIIENAKMLLSKNYQVLVLFKHLQHGENLKKLFDAQNIKYEYLSGTDSLDVRTDVKEKLLSHQSNLVLASTILDIGIDIPSLSGLILGGGGASSVRCYQRCGRILRKYKGKSHAAIIDFFDDVRFLKGHSKKRYDLYRAESGFKILDNKKIPELK